MERFDLKNGTLRLTEQPGLAYRVETGRVLVFLMPWREKKTGRRFLLAEVGPGALVPSLCWEDDVQGSWIFGLSALEEASLTCWEASEGEREEAQVSFAQAAGVRLLDAEAFAEQMVERYNMNLVKEEVYETRIVEEDTAGSSALY